MVCTLFSNYQVTYVGLRVSITAVQPVALQFSKNCLLHTEQRVGDSGFWANQAGAWELATMTLIDKRDEGLTYLYVVRIRQAISIHGNTLSLTV